MAIFLSDESTVGDMTSEEFQKFHSQMSRKVGSILDSSRRGIFVGALQPLSSHNSCRGSSACALRLASRDLCGLCMLGKGNTANAWTHPMLRPLPEELW